MVLQRSEETDASRTNASSGNTANDMMTNDKPAANGTKRGVKRSRSADDTVRVEKLTAVKFIYTNIKEFK